MGHNAPSQKTVGFVAPERACEDDRLSVLSIVNTPLDDPKAIQSVWCFVNLIDPMNGKRVSEVCV
jgi:hypothetical protein